MVINPCCWHQQHKQLLIHRIHPLLKPSPAGWRRKLSGTPASMPFTLTPSHAFSLKICFTCPWQYHWCLWGKAAKIDSPRAGQASTDSPQHPRSKHLASRKPSRAAIQVGRWCPPSPAAAASHCCHSPLPPGAAVRLRLSLLECFAPNTSPATRVLTLFHSCRSSSGPFFSGPLNKNKIDYVQHKHPVENI